MEFLPVKNSLADYTPEEIDVYLDANLHATNSNSGDPNRLDFLDVLANGATKMQGKAFSDEITL
jgi:hypothetical protein